MTVDQQAHEVTVPNDLPPTLGPVVMREWFAVSLADPEGGAQPRPEGQQAKSSILPTGTPRQLVH